MFNVGGGEIIVILLIALIVLGPDRLPSAARQVGKYLNEFRRISSGFQDEIRSAMDVSSDGQAPATPTPSAPPAAAAEPTSAASDSTEPAPDASTTAEAATPEATTGSTTADSTTGESNQAEPIAVEPTSAEPVTVEPVTSELTSTSIAAPTPDLTPRPDAAAVAEPAPGPADPTPA